VGPPSAVLPSKASGRGARAFAGGVLRGALAAAGPPLLVFVLQSLIWSTIRPFAWFLFIPAILASAWLGGVLSGVVSSALSTALVWWAFLPPERTIVKGQPAYFLSGAVFLGSGLAISLLQGRLRSARRAQAAALEKSERATLDLRFALKQRQLLAALVENSSDFIGIASPEGRPIYLNPAGRRMVGLPDDVQIEHTAIPDYYPPDVRPFAASVILREMLEKGHWEGETAFRHWTSGRSIPVSDTHFLIRDPASGEVIGEGTVTRDISELKRAREELEQAGREQRLLAEAGAALSASIDPLETLINIAEFAIRDFAEICIVDLVQSDGTLRRVKVLCSDRSKEQACRAIEGIVIDRPSLVQTALKTRRPVLQPEMTRQDIDSIAQSPTHRQALIDLDLRSSLVVPLLHGERLLGVISLATSRKGRTFGERDLALTVQLAQRAALALENARLYDVAQKATQARDDMLGVVAHDLRNPLGVVLMQARTLERGAVKGERQQKMGASIEHAARRMDRLIRDLLDVTLLEAKAMTLQRSRLQAEELLQQVAEIQGPVASGASVALDVEVEQGILDVFGDRERLLQVFENLVGNAVKFTAAGGRIVLGAAAREAEVLFHVRDTGAGMTPETQRHVFDRFWRQSTGRGGAGLGLSIAKGIVEAHGGRLWCESELGKGTTFYFTLPALGRPGATRTDTPAAPL
jgi:PAS domain S-box-containing protein